jgi:DNA-binding transcriptional LysR family regulator
MMIIMSVNLATVDLKLLVVFDAIMSEHSVSRAAQRLGMSQPAMSNALNRLRYVLKDQLFTRTAEGMRPTARALELGPPITTALKQIRQALEPAHFAPTESRSDFRLTLSDHATVVVLPRLLPLLQRAAPQVRLRILPKRNSAIEDQLDSGDVDFAVGIIPRLPRRFERQDLYEDQYVCLMHRSHPLAGRPMTRSEFMAADHLALRPLDSMSVIDHVLKRHKVSRKVVLNVTQYLAVPYTIRNRNLLACMLGTVAEHFAGDAFYVSPMPFDLEPMKISLVWSRARTHHAANAWLRQKLVEACTDLQRPDRRSAPRSNVRGGQRAALMTID